MWTVKGEDPGRRLGIQAEGGRQVQRLLFFQEEKWIKCPLSISRHLDGLCKWRQDTGESQRSPYEWEGVRGTVPHQFLGQAYALWA